MSIIHSRVIRCNNSWQKQSRRAFAIVAVKFATIDLMHTQNSHCEPNKMKVSFFFPTKWVVVWLGGIMGLEHAVRHNNDTEMRLFYSLPN